MKREIVFALLALGGTAGAVGAQAPDRNDPWMHEVVEALGRARAEVPGAVAGQGTQRYGSLAEGEATVLSFTLEAGKSYVIVATCDRDCGRLALRVADGRRYELDADQSDTRQPALRIAPAVAGVHQLEVMMTRCRIGPCRYGVLVVPTSTPAPPRAKGGGEG